MIKKYWVWVLLIFSIGLFIYKKWIIKPTSNIEIKVVKVNGGWAYDVYKNKKLFIHQPTIPAIEGYKVFSTKEDAEKIATLVKQKLQFSASNFPQISIREIDSCNIKF